MNNLTYLLVKFCITVVIALATLTLFDTNPVTLVIVYAAITTLVNYFIATRLFIKTDKIPGLAIQGISAMVIAWLMAVILEGFRATFATLIALAFTLVLAEYFLTSALDIEIRDPRA